MSSAQALRRTVAVAAALLLLVTSMPLSLLNPGAVLADEWVVTSLADDGSHGTLRYAIDNSDEGDTISFAPGLNGAIYLAPEGNELVIDHALTIEGPGAGAIRIVGDGDSRVLLIAVGDIIPIGVIEGFLESVDPPTAIESALELLQGEPSQSLLDIEAAVVISGLTLSDGDASSQPEFFVDLFDAVGGNVLVLGSSAVIRDCVIETGSALGGGGIAAAASLLSLEGCIVRENTAGGLDLDIPLSGGGGGLLTALAYVAADDCVFEGNAVLANEGGMAIGGGIGSLVSLWDFAGCDIRDNVAHDGPNIPGLGGGVATILSLGNFVGCDIRNNVAGDGPSGGVGGGMLTAYDLLLNVQECTIAGNAAGPAGNGAGGGMCAAPSLLMAVVRDSLIADNTAGADGAEFAVGGGIAVEDIIISTGVGFGELLPYLGAPELEPGCSSPLSLHLVNCTVSGNIASDAYMSEGGGLALAGDIPVGLSFCTVTNNTAGFGGGLSTFPLVLQNAEPGQEPYGFGILKNSIVAGNTALTEPRVGDPPGPPEPICNDIFGPILSLYGNIIGDPIVLQIAGVSEPEIELPSPDGCGDIIGIDPRLGPLADNGGPTLTHALLPDSPALDAACDGFAILEYIVDLHDLIDIVGSSYGELGDVAETGLVAGAPVAFDQRGETRPIDGDADGEAISDSGAFEARPDIEVQGGSSRDVVAPLTATGSCSTMRVTITNEGNAPLLIDSVEFEGPGAGDYSLEDDLSGTVLDPGESIQVRVRFCPRTQGSSEARLVVYSTDPDEPVVEVDLVGRARSDYELAPADMDTSYFLVDPAQVLPGQQVTVSANICNSGEEKGSLTATLSVNGVAEQSQSVAVSGGSCKTVVFTTSKAVPGTYQVSVNGMQGQFSVLAPRTVQGTVASQQDTGLGTGGLIAIVAVALALVGALVVLFRRS